MVIEDEGGFPWIWGWGRAQWGSLGLVGDWCTLRSGSQLRFCFVFGPCLLRIVRLGSQVMGSHFGSSVGHFVFCFRLPLLWVCSVWVLASRSLAVVGFAFEWSKVCTPLVGLAGGRFAVGVRALTPHALLLLLLLLLLSHGAGER